MRLFVAEDMKHVAHILASVFLCGFWLPVWIILAITYDPVYRCNKCGYHDLTKYLANPQLREIEKKQAAINSEKRSAFGQKIANYPYSLHIAVGFFVVCAIVSGLLIYSKSNNRPAAKENFTYQSITPIPEPSTPAELLKRAKDLTGASHSPTAYRWLKQIAKGSNEYAEAQKMIKTEEEKLKKESQKTK
jgi:hypothetical protein